MTPRQRADKVVDDMIEACGYAAEIAALGKARWDADVITRLAGEAVVGRLGDGARKLPQSVRDEIPGIEWDAIIRMRIVVHHVDHRIARAAMDGVGTRRPCARSLAEPLARR